MREPYPAAHPSDRKIVNVIYMWNLELIVRLSFGARKYVLVS